MYIIFPKRPTTKNRPFGENLPSPWWRSIYVQTPPFDFEKDSDVKIFWNFLKAMIFFSDVNFFLTVGSKTRLKKGLIKTEYVCIG
jgi:hypothetical protein